MLHRKRSVHERAEAEKRSSKPEQDQKSSIDGGFALIDATTLLSVTWLNVWDSQQKLFLNTKNPIRVSWCVCDISDEFGF